MDRRGDYLINNNHDNGIPAEVAALLSETFEDVTSSSMSTDEPSTSDVTTPPAGGSCDVIGEKSPGEMEELAPIQREKWAHKMDFVLSVAGGFVGLGNVWRFPYLCYKNGGGAFLIPYAIFLLIGGIPIFFLEVSLGQYMSEGGVTSWRLVPIGTGIGYASMVIVALLNIYYIVILAWAIFYLFQSFTAELPWAKCGHEWNTACCVDTYSVSAANATTTAATTTLASLATTAAASVQCNGSKTSPEIEYWERRVLGLSTGLDDVGGIRWELAGCLALAWVICYFCIWKGVKSTGKVVYFTATFPFLMLIVFLIRGVTLPGAIDGIRFYLTPDTTRLADPQVWIDAGTQIFFSFAICLGALVSLGSYNKFHNNCFRDCVILSMVNSGTSFISGFAIFSVLGFMAREQGVEVKDVASSGPGLAFIAYPKAITLMPASTVWAILFFIMLLLLGLDSQFVETEGFITSIVDLFPRKLRKGYNREVFIACTCGLSFLVGLSMVTNGGMYVFQLFDYYAASGVCLLWVAFFEAGTIAWLYGGERMWQNVTRMIRYRPWPIIKYVWIFGTPVLTTATFIYSMVKFQRLVYNKTYVYPAWGEAIGWTLALSSMLVIPGYAIYAFVVAEGTFHERWVKLTTPNLRRSHEDFDTEHGERLPALERIFGCDTNDRWRAYRSSKKSGCALGDHVVATKSVMEMKGGDEGVMGGCDEGGSDPPSYDVAVESPWTSPDFAADTPM